MTVWWSNQFNDMVPAIDVSCKEQRGDNIRKYTCFEVIALSLCLVVFILGVSCPSGANGETFVRHPDFECRQVGAHQIKCTGEEIHPSRPMWSVYPNNYRSGHYDLDRNLTAYLFLPKGWKSAKVVMHGRLAGQVYRVQKTIERRNW